MGCRTITEAGKVYGRLTALYEVPERRNGMVCFMCQCTCGETVTVRGPDLRDGNTKSCGCHRRDVRRENGRKRVVHGHKCDGGSSPTYSSWRSMKTRVFNPQNPSYPYYGGRGIQICDRWLDKEHGFENFLSDMGERPEGTSLDRRDTHGNYESSNCRWATDQQQQQNRTDTRLSIEKAREIRNLREAGTSLAVIAERFNVSLSAASAVVCRKTWKNACVADCVAEAA